MGKKNELILTELSEKTDEELKEILNQLYQEEQELSFRRRLLHARIDILRAELVARLKDKYSQKRGIITASDLKKLTEILSREFPQHSQE